MAVPKKKKSQSKTRMRRAQYRVEFPALVRCPNCKAYRVSHRVCPECGHYGGRQVLTIKAKAGGTD